MEAVKSNTKWCVSFVPFSNTVRHTKKIKFIMKKLLALAEG